jgi:guanylate kinase
VKRSSAKGKIVIICSPSGGGKTTICNRLLACNRDWTFSVSYTTRVIREGETDGVQYVFVSVDRFQRLRQKGFFAETAQVHQHFYGTPKKPLDTTMKRGGVILLDIDVQGAATLRKKYPDALSIFVLPPSKAELKRRLKRRGTETKAQLKLRLTNAIKEMEQYPRFDYVIINKDINEAVAAADHMIKSWTVGVTFFGRNKTIAGRLLQTHR